MISKRPERLGVFGVMINIVCFNKYLQIYFGDDPMIRTAWRVWHDDKYYLFQQLFTTILWRMIPKRSDPLVMFSMRINNVCFNKIYNYTLAG